MKSIGRMAGAPFRQTPLSTGNMIALAILILCAGFALGWIALATYWSHYCIRFA